MLYIYEQYTNFIYQRPVLHRSPPFIFAICQCHLLYFYPNQVGEKRYKNLALDTDKNLFCHGQKRDYLSRASQVCKRHD